MITKNNPFGKEKRNSIVKNEGKKARLLMMALTYPSIS
jgi:hypothetical protein